MKVRIENWKKLFRTDTKTKYGDTQRILAVYLRLALYLSLIQFSSTGNLHAQSQKPTAPDDRAPRHVRYPEAGHLRDLQTDHDYQYGHDAPPPENPIARLVDWLFRKLSKFLSSSAYQNVWQYVLLATIAGLAIYLLMKAEVLSFLFPKRAQSANLDYENLAENIHEINFDTAVEDAVTERNFRLAVRLLYLQTLKRLTDAGWIAYKPDKTNQQYVYELTSSPLQADFERLTRQFEFVWYGDFPINKARFEAIHSQFKQFIVTPQRTIH